MRRNSFIFYVAIGLLVFSAQRDPAHAQSNHRQWSNLPYTPEWAQKQNPSILSEAQWRALGEYRGSAADEHGAWRRQLAEETAAMHSRWAQEKRDREVRDQRLASELQRVQDKMLEQHAAAIQSGELNAILDVVRDQGWGPRAPEGWYRSGMATPERVGPTVLKIKDPKVAQFVPLWATSLHAIAVDHRPTTRFFSPSDFLGNSSLALQNSLAHFLALAGDRPPTDANARARYEFASAISAAMLNRIAMQPLPADESGEQLFSVATAGLAARALKYNPAFELSAAANSLVAQLLKRADRESSLEAVIRHRSPERPIRPPKPANAVHPLEFEAFRALAAVSIASTNELATILVQLHPDQPERPAWLDDRPTRSGFAWGVRLRIEQLEAAIPRSQDPFAVDLPQVLRLSLDVVTGSSTPERRERWRKTVSAFRADPASHAVNVLSECADRSPEATALHGEALRLMERIDPSDLSTQDSQQLDSLARTRFGLLATPASRLLAAASLKVTASNGSYTSEEKALLAKLLGTSADAKLTPSQRARHQEIIGKLASG